MEWALGLPTRQATPLWNTGSRRWTGSGTDMGIDRMPTTVLTAIP